MTKLTYIGILYIKFILISIFVKNNTTIETTSFHFLSCLKPLKTLVIRVSCDKKHTYTRVFKQNMMDWTVCP